MTFALTQSWRKRAACLDQPVDVFFKVGSSRKAVQEICDPCPVKQECLNMALLAEKNSSPLFGTFGGVSARERSKIHVCKYSDCLNRVKTDERFCSPEHEDLYAKSLSYYQSLPTNNQEYYMQGRLRDGKASLI